MTSDRELPAEITLPNGMTQTKLNTKQGYEDKKGKVKQYIYGNTKQKDEVKQKTIMMVGGTGSGKSTLIDGLCNYIFQKDWEDHNRLKLTGELKYKEDDQSKSQTDWITVYTINNDESNILNYPLNVIDTPGFGDTKGLIRDEELVEQIRILFEKRCNLEIDQIDAVCFVVKTSDARLTASQRYIYESFLSLFGNDITHNIFVMITFVDCGEPKVLDALNASMKAAKLPNPKTFKFNNSALYAYNGIVTIRDAPADEMPNLNSFSKIFWDINVEGSKLFFECLDKLTPKSLILTSEVLEKRQHLKHNLNELQKQVDNQLSIMHKMDRGKEDLKQREKLEKIARDLTNKSTKWNSERVPCEKGTRATYCLECQETCHDDCIYKDDDEKGECSAMDTNGNCKVCPNHCAWGKHVTTNYIKVKTRDENTNQEMCEALVEASKHVAETSENITKQETEYKSIEKDVEADMKRCHAIIQRLREIALKPNSYTESKYIDELIQAERADKKEGYIDKIQILTEFKKKAELFEKHFAEHKVDNNQV